MISKLKSLGSALALIGTMYYSTPAHAGDPEVELHIGAKAAVQIENLSLEARTEERFASTHYYSDQALGARVRIPLPNLSNDYDETRNYADAFLDPWHFKDHIAIIAALRRWTIHDTNIRGASFEATFSKKLDFINVPRTSTTNIKGGISVTIGEEHETPVMYSAFLQLVGVTFLGSEEFYPHVTERLITDSNMHPTENILTTGMFYRSSTWLSAGIECGIRVYDFTRGVRVNPLLGITLGTDF